MTKLQKCLEEQTKEKLISKEKKVNILFFQQVKRSFFLTSSKKLPAWLSKLQPAYLSNILRFNIFWKIAQCFNLLLSLRIKKTRAFSQKDITGYCASRGISWEKVISLSEIFILSGINLEIEQLLCRFAISLTSCGKAAIYVREEKKFTETNNEKLLLYQLRTLSRKKLDFQQNSKAWFSKQLPTSPEEQLQKLSWSNNFCMKVFVFWTGGSDFLRKNSRSVAKGAFHVSSATLWVKDDNSKLDCLGFFKTLRGFYLLWQKN